MDKKTIIGIFAFAFIAFAISSIVAAHQGFGLIKEFDTGSKQFNFENREAIQKAIESKNYSEWKNLHEQMLSQMREQLTEEQFNKAVQRHEQMKEYREKLLEARESGDISKVRELREEQGFASYGRKEMQGHLMENCPLEK